MIKVFEIPKNAQIVVNEYLNLPLGKKNIITPYYMNLNKQRAGLRVLIGKGDPGEIVREVKIVAKIKNVDLYKMNENQIREFMIKNNIGVDCSGFIVHVLNYWLKINSNKELISYLSFPNNSFLSKIKRKLRPIENIGANTLTSLINCIEINNFNEIRPGDLIRCKGLQKNSHHVLLIHKVFLENDIIKSFEYVHSTKYYEEENGVKFGKVVISSPNSSLKDQQWLEVKNGRNWTYEGLRKDFHDNGIRRLKNTKFEFESKTI